MKTIRFFLLATALLGSGVVFAQGVSQPPITVQGINKIIYVDGVKYKTVASALTALGSSPGKIIVPPGTYNETTTLSWGTDQWVEFDNATLNFTLSGTSPAIQSNGFISAQTERWKMTGEATINMGGTGGPFIKYCTGVNMTIDGTWRLINPNASQTDAVTVGACDINSAGDTVVLKGLQDRIVPGNFITLNANNNYSGPQQPSSYILNADIENNFADLVVGYCYLINANATGPELNLNGILFKNNSCEQQAGNTKADVHVQSSLLTGAGNSINIGILGGYLGLASTNPASVVDADSSATAQALQGVKIDGTDILGGSLPSLPFDSNILAYTLDCEFVGFVGADFPCGIKGIDAVTRGQRRVIIPLDGANNVIINNPVATLTGNLGGQILLGVQGVPTVAINNTYTDFVAPPTIAALNSGTATVLNKLAKNVPGGLQIITTSDTNIPVFICVSNCGTAGNAELAVVGEAPCIMDLTASGTSGYYVVASTTVDGECHPQALPPSAGVCQVGQLYSNSTTLGSAANVIIQPSCVSAASTLPASLTTTSGTSDNVTVTGMTGSGHCSVAATNASAATNIATTYISAKTTNQITVTHTATASMTYDILCTPN